MKPLMRLLTLAGVFILIGQLCYWLGSFHWLLELLCHFQLQYGIASVVFLCLSTAVRFWKNAVFFLILTGMGCFHLSPYWLSESIPTAASEKPSLKIISYNLLSSNIQRDQVCDYLNISKPDIVALYEVTPAWLKSLSANLPNYAGTTKAQDDNFGIALLSSWPIEILHRETPSGTGNLLIHALVKTPQGDLEVIACHPIPPIGSWAKERDLYITRGVEIAESSSRPVILVGDLNLTRWSPTYRKVFANSKLKNAQDGRGIQTTWSPRSLPIPGLEIDHFFASEGIKLTSFKNSDKLGSDHSPLEASIILPN